jgi:hypothetical protein
VSNTQREAFEAFMLAEFKVSNPPANHRTKKGVYFYGHVNLAWKAWQEARASAPLASEKEST